MKFSKNLFVNVGSQGYIKVRSFYFTFQVNSTILAISLALARTTVSLLTRSWMAELASNSEPTSFHPNSVNTLLQTLLTGVWKCFRSCSCSGGRHKKGPTCRDSVVVSVTQGCHILGRIQPMFWHLYVFWTSDTKHIYSFSFSKNREVVSVLKVEEIGIHVFFVIQYQKESCLVTVKEDS